MNWPAIQFLELIPMKTISAVVSMCCLFSNAVAAESNSASTSALPLFRVIDLNRGEAARVRLSDGQDVQVKLLEVQETRDPVRSAVREAAVTVEIDGKNITLRSGNYHLPP